MDSKVVIKFYLNAMFSKSTTHPDRRGVLGINKDTITIE